MRVTMVAPPSNKEILKQCALPFAVLATPFANCENGEQEVPFVDLTELAGNMTSNFGTGASAPSSGNGSRLFASASTSQNNLKSSAAETVGPVVQTPPRCTRCRGYVNPSVQFVDQGHKWVCNLCNMSNAVPPWYYCNLDQAGLRVDRKQRPELQLGTVDFHVGTEYCAKPMQVRHLNATYAQ